MTLTSHDSPRFPVTFKAIAGFKQCGWSQSALAHPNRKAVHISSYYISRQYPPGPTPLASTNVSKYLGTEVAQKVSKSTLPSIGAFATLLILVVVLEHRKSVMSR